ncbi:MAG: hypothetical protein M3232_04415, partial [Thermoproteota archaeon]|nr:hypothetical protein [Thermoproteota archaeon]
IFCILISFMTPPSSLSGRTGKTKKHWISKVTTESTFPKKGILTNDAETIARHMASKKVSPKGVGSGIQMIQYSLTTLARLICLAQT